MHWENYVVFEQTKTLLSLNFFSLLFQFSSLNYCRNWFHEKKFKFHLQMGFQGQDLSLKILLWTLLSVNNVCRKHQFVQLYFILYHSNGEIMFRQKSSVVVSNLHRSMEQELCPAIVYDNAHQSAHPSYQHRMHCWI